MRDIVSLEIAVLLQQKGFTGKSAYSYAIPPENSVELDTYLTDNIYAGPYDPDGERATYSIDKIDYTQQELDDNITDWVVLEEWDNVPHTAIIAPTYSEVLRWLETQRNIIITIDFSIMANLKWSYTMYKRAYKAKDYIGPIFSEEIYDSREEALSGGILYVLKELL